MSQEQSDIDVRDIIAFQAAQLLQRERQVATLQRLLHDAQEQLGKAASEIERLNAVPTQKDEPTVVVRELS